jgi:hypothetical protein
VDLLVGGHGGRGVGVLGVLGPGLGTLREREHEHPAEPAGQHAEEPGAPVAPQRRADPVAEEVEPVLLVPTLGVGEREEDRLLLAVAAAR